MFPKSCYRGYHFSLQAAKQHFASSSHGWADNIVVNYDFSSGLHSWHPNCCECFVVSAESGNPHGMPARPGGNYAVVTNRKECWQGLEQDITSRLSPGSTYSISAYVGVWAHAPGSAEVLATLKLEFKDSATKFLFIGKYGFRYSNIPYHDSNFVVKMLRIVILQNYCFKGEMGKTGRYILIVNRG